MHDPICATAISQYFLFTDQQSIVWAKEAPKCVDLNISFATLHQKHSRAVMSSDKGQPNVPYSDHFVS